MPGFRSEEPQSEGAGPGAGGRVLVTGATGLLGRSLCRQLRDDGWSVIATGFSRASPRMHRCDLTSEEQVHHLIHTHKPEVIVHCAAERRPDVVERSSDSALNLNVHATAVLAKEAASCGSFLLYISTDYVFDGRNPPYGEDDAPNPLNLYGRSKMEGEREATRHCPDSVILRVPVLFGEVERVSESAVTALWTSILDSTQTCSVDHVQQRFPTEVRDVARVCSQICSRRRQDPSLRGVLHFSGTEQMTKYEMTRAVAEAFKLPSDHIVAATDPAPGSASRPQNARLDCSRLQLLGLSVQPRPFRAAILDCLWPFTPDRRWRQTVFH
ncbi:methionine adenosyltransferase 2 subunit beta isoform X2 [Eucyclogobius newberryi]|uniref:methionine adenosyltransferase 2 subunit beta isoform X2 n=1 Tax=Eucyclogobius newberryi TaxID=166745 RepID=UPI003B5BA11E